MEKINIRKPVIGILAAAMVMLFLSGCSGVMGGDYNVRISVPQLASGDSRYISGTAESGYVVVMKENKVYSLNSFSDKMYQEFINGNVCISNLPVGDYIFGEGFNDIVIDVGPGIQTFFINGDPFKDFFTPDGYSTTFAEDTIILDIDRVADGESFDIINFAPDSGLGATISGNILPAGGSIGGPSWSVGLDEEGVDFTISGGALPHPYTLKVIIK